MVSTINLLCLLSIIEIPQGVLYTIGMKRDKNQYRKGKPSFQVQGLSDGQDKLIEEVREKIVDAKEVKMLSNKDYLMTLVVGYKG